mgnify:CR=1 FL=1
MNNLMKGESPKRQWFALHVSGDLAAIGDCGDFETAKEIAQDFYENMSEVWIISPEQAQEWADQLASRGIIGKEQR